MKMTFVLMFFALSAFAAPKTTDRAIKNVPQKAPVIEEWLSPARRAQLKAITGRPYITAKRDIGGGREEMRWTNGARSWATTQRVERIMGAKAQNPHEDLKREKQAILHDLKAIKNKPTKAALESIINKHEKKVEGK